MVSAKIVTSSTIPGSKCFGYVVMSLPDEANRCIKHLNKSELLGRIISVERARREPSSTASHRSCSRGKDEKDGGAEEGREEKDADKDEDAKGDRDRDDKDRNRPRMMDRRYNNQRPGRPMNDRLSHGKRHSPGRRSPRRPLAGRLSTRRHSPPMRRSPGRRSEREVLGLNQIIEERDRERMRTRERLMREEERRSRVDDARQRIVERRQREEAERLQRERQQLRAERERIERQKQELLRLERENQRLEREKLEREREELRRQQMKLARTDSGLLGKGSSRYDEVRPARSLKRSADDRNDHFDDRKRVNLGSSRGAPDDSRSRFDDPPHRRYDNTSRDSHRYDNSAASGSTSGSHINFRESGGNSRYDSSRSQHSSTSDNTRWMGQSSSSSGSPWAYPRRTDSSYHPDRREGQPDDSRKRDYTSTSVLNPGLPPPAPSISKPRDSRYQSGVTIQSEGGSTWRQSSGPTQSSGRWESRSTNESSSSSSSRGALPMTNFVRTMGDMPSGMPVIPPDSQGRSYVMPTSTYRKY